MILVDTNIWLDMLNADPIWREWSMGQLRKARQQHALAINIVVFSELAPAFDTMPELEQFVALSRATLCPISQQAGYLAGQALRQYKKQGGTKTGVMPDFFIGAHAQAEGWTLLTRDAARYKTYFPKVKLICPQT